MIVAGDWLIPVDGRPIRDGAVLTRGSRVEGIGRLSEVAASAPAEPVERFEGCVLMPGLVDAHTHLSLTVLGGLIAPAGLAEQLARVNTAVLAMGNDELAASASLGALQCLTAGITCVGDVGYGPEPLASCADTGVGGVFCWEVHGVDAHGLAGELADAEFPAEVGACTTGRVRCGITPHSTFMSGPELIQAAWKVAHTHRTGFHIHAAESAEEHDLMIRGTGPLAGMARTFAHGFSAPGIGSIAYLEHLGALKDAVALGCARLEAGDPARLKRLARGAVLCPLAARRMEEWPLPFAELYAAGVRVALGTGTPLDEAGSDLFAEARALREADASLTSRRLIAMMTSEGAEVLGLGDMFGTLAPGMQSDVIVVHTGPVEDPETAVMRVGGRDTVRAVLAAGVWRVREGKPALPTAATERAADRARRVVERALAR